jgi:hypothetical protein
MTRSQRHEKQNHNEAVNVKRSEVDRKFEPTDVAESKRAEWEREQKVKD